MFSLSCYFCINPGVKIFVLNMILSSGPVPVSHISLPSEEDHPTTRKSSGGLDFSSVVISDVLGPATCSCWHNWTTAGNCFCLEIMQGKKKGVFSSFFSSVCACSVVYIASERGKVWIETRTTLSILSSIQCCCQGGRKTRCNPTCSKMQNTLQKLGASPMKHICRNSLWNWWCVSEAERLVRIATWNDGKHRVSVRSERDLLVTFFEENFHWTPKVRLSSLLTASFLYLCVGFPFQKKAPCSW